MENVNFDNRMTIEGNENMVVISKEEYDELLELVHRGTVASEVLKGHADRDIHYSDDVVDMVSYALFGFGMEKLKRIREEERRENARVSGTDQNGCDEDDEDDNAEDNDDGEVIISGNSGFDPR